MSPPIYGHGRSPEPDGHKELGQKFPLWMGENDFPNNKICGRSLEHWLPCKQGWIHWGILWGPGDATPLEPHPGVVVIP